MTRRSRPTSVLLLLLLSLAVLPALAGCRGADGGDPPGGGTLADNVLHLRLEGTDHRNAGPVRVVGDDLTALGVRRGPDLPPVADGTTRVGFVVIGCRQGDPAVLVADEHHGLLGATFPEPVDGDDVACETPEYYAEVFDVPTEVLDRTGVNLDDGRRGR